ncbi:MAG: hypothetical protein ACXAEU_15895 [Candidatus Hodarchaeales archaeon]|jgi:hypothetical protein
MTVLEVGLISEGLPVIKRDYQKLSGVQVDPVIKSGLFSAINAFTREVFGDTTEELKLKKFVICIKQVEMSEGSLFLYAIADKSTKTKPVTIALEKLSQTIAVLVKEENLRLSSVDPSSYDPIGERIDEEMKDLRLKPADRAKKLFG